MSWFRSQPIYRLRHKIDNRNRTTVEDCVPTISGRHLICTTQRVGVLPAGRGSIGSGVAISATVGTQPFPSSFTTACAAIIAARLLASVSESRRTSFCRGSGVNVLVARRRSAYDPVLSRVTTRINRPPRLIVTRRLGSRRVHPSLRERVATRTKQGIPRRASNQSHRSIRTKDQPVRRTLTPRRRS